MSSLTKSQQRVADRRIQDAITGLQIPMLQIPALYKFARDLISTGVHDDNLRQGVEEWVEAHK